MWAKPQDKKNIMKEGRNTLKRRSAILDILKEKGKISVNDLSTKFNISVVSIRNDLAHLEKKGLLIKTRGGAIKSQPVNFDLSLNQKLKINYAEKQRIGKKAAEYVNNGDSVVIDSGSTTLEVAKNLEEFKINLITNSLPIADLCADFKEVDVIIPGGELRAEMRSLIGPITVKTISEFHCDIAFIGADSISVEGGIYTPLISEASISRAMIKIAKKVIVVVDSSKFSRKSLAKISSLKHIDTIITDQNISKSDLIKLKDFNIEIILV